MIVDVRKVKTLEGFKCPHCGNDDLYPIIYTENITLDDILDREPFVCENCFKHFYAIKGDGTIRFLEDVE